MTNLSKRICLGTLLGAIFGLLCFLGFMSSPDESMAAFQVRSRDNAFMWSTIINRMILGTVIGFAGIMTQHPIFKFKLNPFLRGIFMGIFVSLGIAIGVFMGPDGGEMSQTAVFGMILGFGAIIGIIIDLILTKIYGQGKKLLN